MKSKNRVARAITEAKKEKSEVRLNIRLQKNGQFSSVSGFVKELKVNAEGEPYAVVKPKGNKHIQSVPLNNVLAVVKDGEIVKR